MKILVIDDTKKHLDAAVQTLTGHEVTLCSSYDEALKLLTEKWDVVLCDLLMPAGKDAQGPNGYKFIGQKIPAGWSLALAAARHGAKYVAVASDMGHHDHPASAMLDRLNEHLFKIDDATVLMTNHVSLIGIAGTECVCPKCNGTLKATGYSGGFYDCYCKNGTSFGEKGKNWGEILDYLLGKKKFPLS